MFVSGIWVGWKIEKGKVIKKCQTISKVGLGGMDDWKSESRTELQNNFKSWIGWDKVGWMIEKSESRTEVQFSFFSKLDWVGLLIENVREKQNWESESYVLGRIDIKTGGIHNVSYTPISASCKSSNTQNEKNWLWKM